MQGVELFFKYLFGTMINGFVCLAQISKGRDQFREEFFQWPEQLDDMIIYVGKRTGTHNLYVCPQILRKPIRKKEHVLTCPSAWADLDTCSPGECIVPPTISIETSHGRYQAYWLFEEPFLPEDAEAISRRIAYYHSFQGADRSGWDLTQMLRVPHTTNFNHGEGEPVKVLEATRARYRMDDFEKYPQVVATEVEDVPMPEDLSNVTSGELLAKFAEVLPPQVDLLFNYPPDSDSWNENLWRLEMTLFEAGLTPEEVFIIVRDAACNRYRRDKRPDFQLWKEVCRSHVKHAERAGLNAPQVPESQSPLLLDSERDILSQGETSDFVQEYITWAKTLGDAAPQYHQAGAFIILSTLLSGSVRLPTSFGTIKPNLWFMLLADTTLTRKSTAMDIAMDLIEEVDSSAILATDGSIEGLMGSLSTRPGRPSVFLRDEFSGLLESITKKDYYAGMAEMLTKLYDGKLQKRLLKKEVIEIKDPCLVLFAGGIRNKVCSLLNAEMISSGFVPRFVFITAESDATKVKPLGPPTQPNTEGRDKMLSRMRDMYMHYKSEARLTEVDGKLVMSGPPHWNAQLDEEAWLRYNKLEADMMKAGLETDKPDILTPTYDRLCKSILKAAVLLAAAEQRPKQGEPVTVTLHHLLYSIGLCEEWRQHANDIIAEVGLSQNEREYQRVFGTIKRTPGISRSRVMQAHHLNARSADMIFETLEQRGLIFIIRGGGRKGQRLFTFDHINDIPSIMGKHTKLANATKPTKVRFNEREATQ
jgi:hypothetical protein